MIYGLKSHVGSEDSVTSTEIVRKLKEQGYKINGARVRKLVHHIRVTGIIKNLIASSKGYYITNDPKELERFKSSLLERRNSIDEVIKAME